MKQVILYLFLALSHCIYSQSASIVVSETISVCEDFEIVVVVNNNNDEVMSDPELYLELPCDMEYQENSISAGRLIDSSIPGRPGFILNSILPGQSETIRLRVNTNCGLYSCLNNLVSLVIAGSISWGEDSISMSSAVINIESPNLVISGIDRTYEEVPSLGVFKRKIRITNTRTSRVSEFQLSHIFDPYFSIQVNQGEVINFHNGKQTLRYDGSDFERVGNRDEFLDPGESIEVEETLQVLACHYDRTHIKSDYEVSWGCGGEICQSSSAIAQVRLTGSIDRGAKIIASVIPEEPFCLENAVALQTLNLRKNPHINPLTDCKIIIETTLTGRGVIVESLNSGWPFEVEYLDVFENDCGQKLARKVILTIERIDPTAVITNDVVTWRNGFCEPSTCNSKANAYTVAMEYRKECADPSDSFFTFNADVRLPDMQNISIFGNLLGDTGNIIQQVTDEQIGFIQVRLNDIRLIHFNARDFQIKLTFSRSFDFDNFDFIVNGVSPVSVVVTEEGGNKEYLITYPLPFDERNFELLIPYTFRCDEYNVTDAESDLPYASCICNESFRDSILMEAIITSHDLCDENARPKGCYTVLHSVDCPGIPIIYADTLALAFGYTGTMERISFGQSDKDNNGVEDENQNLDDAVLDLHRLLPGDTLRVSIAGQIFHDRPDQKPRAFSVGLTPLIFFSESLEDNGVFRELLFEGDGAFRTIRNKFTLKKRHTGQIIEISNIPEIGRSLTDLFILSADSLASFHPVFDRDFYYEPGDSIWLDIYKVIDLEPFQESKDDLRLEQFFLFTLGIQTHVGHSIPQFLETSPCDCTFERILIPEQYINAPAAFVSTFFQNTDICIDESISRRILSLNFGYFYRSENLPFELPVFPNEIRPIVQVKEIHFSRNENVELGQLVITYGNRVFRFEPEYSGDKIIYRTEDVLPWSGHGKRFQYHLDYSIRPNGCINNIPPDILNIDIFLNRTPLGEIYYPEKLSTRIQYQFLRPQLRAIVLEPEITAFSEAFRTQIDMFFNDNINSIEHAYIKLNTASGNIGQFSLRDVSTQELFVSDNGYFHIGTFRRGDKRRFEINGTLNSCESEKLFIEYGFDCDDFSDPAYEPCFSDTDTILIHFPQGLIDIVPLQNADNHLAMCDTSTQSLTVLNAGLGKVYDNVIELDIPPGINYIPGSGKLYYPGNQRQNFISLPDPVFTGSDIYQWSIGQVWSEHISGLNGANDMPLNTYDIEYNIVTSCDVISGSSLTYRVSAKDYCQDPLNQVIKTGQTITIDDLMASEPVQIQGSYTGLSACSKRLANLQYQFFLNSDGPQIFQVRLPVGFEMVANSVFTNLSDPDPIINGRLLAWNVMPSDSVVNIALSILNKSEFLCENNIVEAFLSEATSVICAQTGMECDIFSASGQNQIILSPEIFDVDIQEIKLSAKNGQYHLTFGIEKVAVGEDVPLEFILFKDNNMNEQLDISDEVLDTLYWEGNSVNPDFILSGSINTEDICSLSLLLSKVENCLCEQKYYPLNQNVTIETPDLYICSGENVEIGIEGIEGFDYQWNSGQGMGCTQCPKAVFSVENQTNDAIEILRILEMQNDNNCRIRLEYPLVIPPELVLNAEEVTICQGDTVRVLSDFASQYLWQGPEIDVNNIQELVVSPSENAIYSWTAIDSFGCQYSDSFKVIVSQRPSLEVLHHLPLCPDSSAQLEVNLINADYYTWNLRNLLAKPDSLRTSFKVYTDTTLILEAFNEACKEIFFIPIEFFSPAFSFNEVNLCEGDFFDFNGQIIRAEGEYCQSYESESGCDSLSCVRIFLSELPDVSSLPQTYLKPQGEDLIISGFEGFESYFWIPNNFLSCDICAAPVTTTTDTITYIIELTDEAGCKAIHRVFIDIEKTCQFDEIIFPNGFSPNGDGINDIFSLIFDGFCGSMDIVVYNRWGNVVYDMEDWDNAWDGRSVTGEILPQGTYFYNIRLRILDQSVSGMIDLRLK